MVSKPQVVYVQKPSNGFSTASFVLGIVGLVLLILPMMGWVLGLMLGLLAIVFGMVGTSVAKSRQAGMGLGIAGMILGVVTVILAIGLIASS